MENKGICYTTPTGFLNNYDPIERIQLAAIWIKNAKRNEKFNSFAVQPFNINEGLVITGWRHNSCYMLIIEFMGEEYLNSENADEGFITSHNRYVDRKEGLEIAIKAGQLKESRKYTILTSEDLY